MLISIFYDKKNKREVMSSSLFFINLVEEYAVIDSDDTFIETGRRTIPQTFEPMTLDQYLSAKQDGYFNDIFPEGIPEWDSLKKEMTPMVVYPKERVLANIGYKSETCPSYKNWDLYCQDTDLVFLRFEEFSK
jgi:hypothetical protein